MDTRVIVTVSSPPPPPAPAPPPPRKLPPTAVALFRNRYLYLDALGCAHENSVNLPLAPTSTSTARSPISAPCALNLSMSTSHSNKTSPFGHSKSSTISLSVAVGSMNAFASSLKLTSSPRSSPSGTISGAISAYTHCLKSLSVPCLLPLSSSSVSIPSRFGHRATSSPSPRPNAPSASISAPRFTSNATARAPPRCARPPTSAAHVSSHAYRANVSARKLTLAAQLFDSSIVANVTPRASARTRARHRLLSLIAARHAVKDLTLAVAQSRA